MDEQEVKQMTGKPGRPKGVSVIGSKDAAAGGVKVLGRVEKGTKILDKHSTVEPSHVEVTHGEDDNDN